MTHYEFPLSAGTLELDVTSSVIPLFDILSIGERINPKRPFMFVSHLVGRYTPTSNRDLHKYSKMLVDLIPMEDFKGSEKISCISLSETGLLMGSTITRYIHSKVDHPIVQVNTTRVNRTLPILCEFVEPHSHLTNHRIYMGYDEKGHEAFKETEVLVMIDDEITTGNTLVNLFKSLALTKVHTVILLSLTDWSKQPIAIDGVDLKHYSLVKGDYRWIPKEGIDLPEIPYEAILKEESNKVLDTPLNSHSDYFMWRAGPYYLEHSYFGDFSFLDSLRTLTILVNEMGSSYSSVRDTFYLSMSSSPLVVDGIVIKSMYEFSGFYNKIPLYLYNIEEAIYRHKIEGVRIITDNTHKNQEFLDEVHEFFSTKFPHVSLRNY